MVFELKRKGYFSADTARDLENSYSAWVHRELAFEAYERHVIDALVGSLPHIPPHVFDDIAREVADRSGRKNYVYTSRLLKELRSKGYFLLAMSGSQQEVAKLFAKRHGFDDCIGSLYERKGDRFTGTILRFVPGNKAELINAYAAEHGFSLDDSVAVGDSNGDISMLDLVDFPIAFNPNDKLLAVARERGWTIVIERKNVALTLEPRGGQTTLTNVDILQ